MGETRGPYERTEWPPVPRTWDGETVAIIGCGPSLTQGQVEQTRGACKVLVINNSYRLAPWADLLYSCDAKWWECYQPKFHGLKATQDARVTRADVFRIPSVKEPGLSLDPLRIHQGANSGYQALNLAVLMGAMRILLLGFDMHVTNGTHFHGDHLTGLANPSQVLTEQWCLNFATTLPDLKRACVKVVNCTPGSALTCFPRVPLEDVLHVWI